MFVFLMMFLLCPTLMLGAMMQQRAAVSSVKINAQQFDFTLMRTKCRQKIVDCEYCLIKTTLTNNTTKSRIGKTVVLTLQGEVDWTSEDPSFHCLPQDRKMMRELFQKAIAKFGLIRKRPDPDSDDEDNPLIANRADWAKPDAIYQFNVGSDGEPTTPVITFDNKITEVEDEETVHIKPRCQDYCDILLLGVSAGIILPLAIWAQYTAID